MKVFFDHQIASVQTYGGISRYFVELAKHIPRVSHGAANVHYIAPFYKNIYISANDKQIKKFGIQVPHIRFTGWLLNHVNNLISSSIYYYSQPDIIHETYYSRKKIGPDAAYRIITVYDMIHELFPKSFPTTDKTCEIKKIAINRADHIICISQNTQNDLINILGVDRGKTSVVYLGFELNNTHQDSTLKTNKPYILYVGERSGYKNFIGLLKAYASSEILMTSFNLVCVGGGAFNMEETDFFKKLNIPQTCIQHVSVNDEILYQYYKNASLFVYPSLYEGFGIPPLEAMSCGCPVACSDTSSIPEVVGDAATFFNPYSEDSIRYTLEKTLEDSLLRTTLISKGLERIKMFSWEKCANETYQVYQNVLK
jgi:glycosyltransferase involved in cell wall biosynthesis